MTRPCLTVVSGAAQSGIGPEVDMGGVEDQIIE